MPSARIHEAIALELNKDRNFDELLLRIGTVAPDSWRNIQPESGVKDKYLGHFWDFRIKEGQANGYQEFYLKYYDDLNNPFYFGYLIHLIVDQYWKTNIDPIHHIEKDGVKGFKLKDGSFHDDSDWWGYYDTLKMQKQIASLYNLSKLPINMEDYSGFKCEIDELNLNGLFGDSGTLNYINTNILPTGNDGDSEIYDLDEVIRYIKETTLVVENEIKRLENIKKESDAKIKIAVDIDDTILSTKELEDFYWKEFMTTNPSIGPKEKYKWGDPELALFWKLYREKMAFGEIKPGVKEVFDSLLSSGYEVDLLSARPLDKYASLKKRLVEYFETNGINFNYMNLGFHSKKEFLSKHKYDILIDNEMRNINDALSVGVTPILFGSDSSYEGYQTMDFREIPKIVESINKKIKI